MKRKESLDEAYQRLLKTKESPSVTGPLKDFWLEPVGLLCELNEPWVATPEWQERHRIYAYLLMALVYHYWNGYKYGRPKKTGDYPLNPVATADDSPWLDGAWFGYNIGAVAVDALGYVLDFDFNHNDLFSSSAEHAEARLVRRLYSLAQINDAWGVLPGALPKQGDSPTDVRRVTLNGVTVYASLESCAQCAGVMALAQIQQVVYLQTDPQYFFIGRILRNLTSDRGRAPLPISGGEIALPFFEELDREFKQFATLQAGKDETKAQPFWQGGTDKHWSSSVTSFLCTEVARSIFKRGSDKLTGPLRYPDFVPQPDGGTAETAGGAAPLSARKMLTNAEAELEAARFLEYAKRSGLRGTPHNI